MAKKSLGFYIVNVFAFLLMTIGLALISIEGVVHYRPFFSCSAAVSNNWTVTPFAVGGMMIIFGALVLAYTIVLPALSAVEGMGPFLTTLINAVRPLTGSRATDVKAAEILQTTAEHELKTTSTPPAGPI